MKKKRTAETGIRHSTAPFLSFVGTGKLTKMCGIEQYVGTISIGLIGVGDRVRANASPAPEPVRVRGDRHEYRTAGAATAGYDRIPRNSPADRRSTKKNFLVMTLAPLRALAFCFFCSLCRTLYLRL
jgi:hypothetical protein